MKKLSIISTLFLALILISSQLSAQQVKCKYVKLDGIDDYLISDTNATYHTTSYTIETWFKFNSTGSGWKFLTSTMSAGSGSRYTYYDYGAQRFVLGYRSGGFQDHHFNYTLDTSWHHIAYVYDQPNANIKAYVDGILIDSVITNGATADTQPTQMVVGRAPGSPTNVSDCNFEEVRYWNVARTQQEIVTNMNVELTGSEPNLIGYWNMDDNNSSDAADLSTNTNNLSLTNGDSSDVWVNNCQTPISGAQSTSSIDFNGSGGRVTIPASSAADISQGSYGAWVKFDGFGSTYQRIIYKEGLAELFYLESLKRFEAEIVVNGIRYEVFTDSSSLSIDTSQWYHLMVTYDTNDFKIYVDGNLESTNSTPQGQIDSQPNSWGIGASPTSGAWSFNGEIDEVTLFDRALNATEVNSLLCNQIDITNPLYLDLVAYYKFDDNTGTTAIDEINSNNGTLLTGTNWTTQGMPNFKPQIIVNTNTLSSNITGTAYQWYLGGSPLAGGTNQMYNATQNGNYQVEVTSEYGCVGTSDIEPFVLTGLDEFNQFDEINIYPNPTNGIVNFSNSQNIQTVSIIDISGKEVLNTSATNSLDISFLETGVYIVKITSQENQVGIFKLFKQ